MKILIATGIFPPQSGGPATYSKLLVEQLPVLGHEVSVMNFGDYLHLPKEVRHVVYTIRLFHASRRVDVVYAQDPVSVGLPAYIVSKLSRRSFLLKVVGDYAWEQGSQRYCVTDSLDVFASATASFQTYPLAVRLLKRIQRRVALGAKQVVVPSEYLKKILMAWGVPAERITVIYNGFKMPEVNEANEGARLATKKMLGLAKHSVVSVSRLVPWKGFDCVIDVAVKLGALENVPTDFRLYIVGDGPDRVKLEEKAARLKAPVTFVGKVEHEKVLAYLSACDVFVLNTSYEGFSHLLLEAMGCGVPIVTTPVGGNVELIADGKTGLLVGQNDEQALASAISRLLNDKSFASALAAAARARLSDFSDEKMLARLDVLLRAF